MFKLFQRNSKPSSEQRLKALHAAVLKNKTAEAGLLKKVHKLQAQIDSDLMLARNMAVSQPSTARGILERRKQAMHAETLLSRQLKAVQQRSSQLELAISTTQVVDSAAETHKALMAHRNPNAVDLVGDILDGVSDLMGEEEEVAAAAGECADIGPVYDVDEELSALQAEAMPTVGQEFPESMTPVLAQEVVQSPTQHRRQNSSCAVDFDKLLAWQNKA